jgi:16S rRNA (guanine966-N2)-methyltransferase
MIDIVRQDSLAYLHGPAQVFDVVFIDAPFTDTQTVQAALDRLTEGGWIESGARIYLETAVTSSQLLMPLGWELFRDKRAGQVSFRLYAYRPE